MKNIKSQDCPSFSESHPLSKREELILRKHLDTIPFFTRKDDGYYFVRNKSLDGSNYGYYRFDNIYEIIELLKLKNDLEKENTRGVINKIRKELIDVSIDDFYLVEWLLFQEEDDMAKEIINLNRSNIRDRMEKTFIKTMEVGDTHMSIKIFKLWPSFKTDQSFFKKLYNICFWEDKKLDYSYLSFILSELDLSNDNWNNLEYFLKLDDTRITNSIMRNPTLNIELIKSHIYFSNIPKIKIMKSNRIKKDDYLQIIFKMCFFHQQNADDIKKLIDDDYIEEDDFKKILSILRNRNDDLYEYTLKVIQDK